MSEEEKQELATKYYEHWQDAEARCLALETWVKAVGKRREAAESRAAQLEEALRFYASEDNWLLDDQNLKCLLVPDDESVEGPDVARAALSREPSEAPEKEGEKPWPRYPLFSSEAPEKEGEDG